jgi:maltose alpha-D-glucosyltransferase/alpha-amylase
VEFDRANTSIAFGDTLLLKIYRRFEAGSHPEVVLLTALQGQSFPSIPRIYSAVTLSHRDGPTILSALMSYVSHQGNGWTFTVDALSRFFDRARESRADAPAQDADEVIGGVYRERMRALGESMAALHTTLADESAVPFLPEPFGALYQRSLYQAMRSQAGRVLRLLRRESSQLSEENRAMAARIIEERPAMLRAFSPLLDHRFAAAKTRVHGDLHLGQLLNTGKDFAFIDFEGEAGRPIGERALKRCPLVDLAAMLRSLDYAASVALRREPESDRERLRPWTALWMSVMTETLTSSYFKAATRLRAIPAQPEEQTALLKIFLIDRALRELSREITLHSEYTDVALKAVSELLLPAPIPDAVTPSAPSPSFPPAAV